MIGNPQQPNPLAGLIALLGNNSAAPAPTQQAAASPAPGVTAPQQGAPAPAVAPASPFSGMMAQAQQALQSPMGQAVPQSAGLIDTLKHPVISGILNAIANAAQSFGWTAMMPEERLQRTQLQQQKAQALAGLAGTQAYREGELETRREAQDTASERAKTYAEDVQSKTETRQVMADIAKNKLELAQDANKWKQEMAQGRLDLAHQTLDQRAKLFEENLKIAAGRLGVEQAKVQLMDQGVAIKQGFLDLAKSALSQKGTAEGVQTLTKLQQLAIEHPLMSSWLGLDDVTSMVGQAGRAGMPGVAPVAPAAQPTPTGVPAPEPTGKAAAKKKQASGGETHIYYGADGRPQ